MFMKVVMGVQATVFHDWCSPGSAGNQYDSRQGMAVYTRIQHKPT